jgi:hypothetical protein
VAYDSCSHQTCDDITNLSVRALSEMSDAAAHAVLTLARSATGFFPDGSFRRPGGATGRVADGTDATVR